MPDIQIPLRERQASRRKRIAIWATSAVLGVAAIFGAIILLPSGPSVSRRALVIATVHAGMFRVRVQAPGTLKPRGERFVTASVPGTVQLAPVRPGDRVQPGTVLVRLVNPHLQSALVAARSNLADAVATLVSTRAELDNQLLSLQAALATEREQAEAAGLRERAERGLAAEHVVARLDYQKTVLDAANARLQMGLTARRIDAFKANRTAQLQAQAARVAAFQAALAEAHANVAALAIAAGERGVVQNVAVHPGQTLALGGAIARVASLTRLRAALDVAPSEAGEIADGQRVTVRLNDAGETRIAGIVTRVSPSVADGSVRVDVKLPAHPPHGTRPNLAVLGIVDITTIPHTLYVSRPVDARPGSTARVFKLIKGGSRAIPIRVRFGEASNQAIQVLGGLKRGDRIIVSDTGRFAGKPLVRIR